jgi:hypothetical protein
LPEYIQLQAYYYMAAMDYPVWDIAAMIGDELRIIPVARLDPAAERAMLMRVREWHQRYIEGDERPDLGGSATAAHWLQATFPHNRRNDLREATPEEIAILTEYAELRFEQKAIEERRPVLENLLKAAIADRDGLVWPSGKFTWRRIKDSTTTDWESLSLALLNLYIAEDDKREELLNFYTRPKPGYRKIRFEHDDLRNERE